MADKTCSQSAPLSCPVGWLQRRRALEDAPMTRFRGPQEQPCPCRGCDRDLAATLELQTQLLYDILGAVNGLAAAQLTGRE